ncbi:hypothetical protein CAXC1_180035 [Candidatus Xenohaliotis californiensis]|uniref:Uncharacterized protein n=1 Tax=Candidatus Xenohaliotis californiensis TaxID=84677 RepID=A0ABP0ES89_9RICK|nr:hypothetical protein CAXC1_180035 [Candidatus Xenohaliotis californiensis]
MAKHIISLEEKDIDFLVFIDPTLLIFAPMPLVTLAEDGCESKIKTIKMIEISKCVVTKKANITSPRIHCKT